MKKTTFFLSLFLIVAVSVSASNKEMETQRVNLQEKTSAQTQERLMSPSPTVKTIQNQN